MSFGNQPYGKITNITYLRRQLAYNVSEFNGKKIIIKHITGNIESTSIIREIMSEQSYEKFHFKRN
jgi:hypothetical protein